MPTYSFVCHTCGSVAEVNVDITPGPGFVICPGPYCPDLMRRDYRAEDFEGGAELRRENRQREGGVPYLREQAHIENKEEREDAAKHAGD
ncbi:MAG: hypothetical protein ACRD2A_03865 [Vicinamibacterales bacterium]